MSTPRALTANTNYAQPELRDQDGELVAVVTAYQNATARRLAACWNACEGLYTESLERGDPLAQQIVDALNRACQAEAQRDALLDSLQQIALHSLAHDMVRSIALEAIKKHQPAQPAPGITVTTPSGCGGVGCDFKDTEPYGSRCTVCGFTIPF